MGGTTRGRGRGGDARGGGGDKGHVLLELLPVLTKEQKDVHVVRFPHTVF
jgi:hypothetical protein